MELAKSQTSAQVSNLVIYYFAQDFGYHRSRIDLKFGKTFVVLTVFLLMQMTIMTRKIKLIFVLKCTQRFVFCFEVRYFF